MPLIGRPMLLTTLASRSGGMIGADRLPDLIGQDGRLLDPRTGRGPHMDLDGAGVDRGEKVLPEERREAERQEGDTDEARGKNEPMLKRQSQQAEVALAKPSRNNASNPR